MNVVFLKTISISKMTFFDRRERVFTCFLVVNELLSILRSKCGRRDLEDYAEEARRLDKFRFSPKIIITLLLMFLY